MRIGTVAHVVRALQVARGAREPARLDDSPWGGVTFLVGAGCSRSAGILLAVEIAQQQADRLQRCADRGR